MLETESGKRKKVSGQTFTWQDSFEHKVLVAISEAEVGAARGEGHVLELLQKELASNADLRTLLADQPQRGFARRIAKGDTFPKYRGAILDFIKAETKEVHWN